MLSIGSLSARVPNRVKLAGIAILTAVSFVFLHSHSVLAQTRGVRDTTTAYGARLNGKGEPAKKLNENRLNNRVNNRIDSRLSLRIERYRLDNVKDPTAAFKGTADDKSRLVPGANTPIPQAGIK
jgi:hypothetical protein